MRDQVSGLYYLLHSHTLQQPNLENERARVWGALIPWGNGGMYLRCEKGRPVPWGGWEVWRCLPYGLHFQVPQARWGGSWRGRWWWCWLLAAQIQHHQWQRNPRGWGRLRPARAVHCGRCSTPCLHHWSSLHHGCSPFGWCHYWWWVALWGDKPRPQHSLGFSGWLVYPARLHHLATNWLATVSVRTQPKRDTRVRHPPAVVRKHKDMWASFHPRLILTCSGSIPGPLAAWQNSM